MKKTAQVIALLLTAALAVVIVVHHYPRLPKNYGQEWKRDFSSDTIISTR